MDPLTPSGLTCADLFVATVQLMLEAKAIAAARATWFKRKRASKRATR